MEYQSELWVILKDDEYHNVWDRVNSEFHFWPSMKNEHPTFEFQIPVDFYDLCDFRAYEENKLIVDETMKSIFVECMGDDDFMYALDWQHTGFRYNPRVNTTIEYPVFIKDERYECGGYNVYFPEFYPNGDYYFFIAKDFRWGYLTHPWLNKAWVFGDRLMQLFQENAAKMGFMPCAE